MNMVGVLTGLRTQPSSPCLIFLGKSAAMLGFGQFLVVPALGRWLAHVVDEGLEGSSASCGKLIARWNRL